VPGAGGGVEDQDGPLVLLHADPARPDSSASRRGLASRRDASSASKEAIVNLLKIKTDTADKMAKIADLMTRIKLKERDTFPRYLAAQQNNKVIIEGSKREMIKSLNKLAQRKQINDKPN